MDAAQQQAAMRLLRAGLSEAAYVTATTIIGLACGTAAYVILTGRQHWVTEAVREQRFLAERIAAELARES